MTTFRDRLEDAKSALDKATSLEWDGFYEEADLTRQWALKQIEWAEFERFEPEF